MIHYKTDNATLFLGDSLEIMNGLNAESIDLIFADPPYNLSNDGFTCQSGKQVSVNKGCWDKSQGFDTDYEFHNRWIESCNRILKPNGTLWISGTYHSIYACGFALQKQGWHIINDIAWFKPNAAPNLACRQFAASHETLLWAKKNKKAKHTFNYSDLKYSTWENDFIKKPDKQMRSVWAINTSPQSEKKNGKHPTQKPLALLERIILASTNKGDLVLDPFCGSATTGVASLQNERKFIGIDSEIEYLDKLAIPRINECSLP
jgi:site-specific DNA-methyltransferase (adenine-specific)